MSDPVETLQATVRNTSQMMIDTLTIDDIPKAQDWLLDIEDEISALSFRSENPPSDLDKSARRIYHAEHKLKIIILKREAARFRVWLSRMQQQLAHEQANSQLADAIVLLARGYAGLTRLAGITDLNDYETETAMLIRAFLRKHEAVYDEVYKRSSGRA